MGCKRSKRDPGLGSGGGNHPAAGGGDAGRGQDGDGFVTRRSGELTLLAVIDQEILYKSLERDKIIIEDTVKNQEMSKDDIDTLLATIRSIKNK